MLRCCFAVLRLQTGDEVPGFGNPNTTVESCCLFVVRFVDLHPGFTPSGAINALQH